MIFPRSRVRLPAILIMRCHNADKHTERSNEKDLCGKGFSVAILLVLHYFSLCMLRLIYNETSIFHVLTASHIDCVFTIPHTRL